MALYIIYIYMYLHVYIVDIYFNREGGGGKLHGILKYF